MMNEAYVVGYGIIDALGNNPQDCFSNLLNDQDYTSDIDFLIEQNHKITRGATVNDIPESSIKGLTKMQRMSMYATEQALTMANLAHSDNVAVLFSTTVNDLEEIGELYVRHTANKRVHPRMILNRIPDMLPSYIASQYQFMGACASLYSSCATGLATIDYAMRMLDEYDYVIVGSGDAACTEFPIKSFNALGAMSNVSSPFDDDRDGFVMGDGVGVLILQSKHMIQKYNSRALARLYPVGIANDAYDNTSPAEDGRGSKLAIEKALQSVTGDIHAVNAHATSTPIGDAIEYRVVTERFGNIPIYAPKGKTGHTMAGCGVTETIYAIESMRQGIIPHIHNLKSATIDSHDCLVKTNQQYPDRLTLRTLNNSFGFGGKCCSQVIEVTKI
jgi:3-oxoacyl-[acyl-carrier-protein] synthase II